MSPSRFIYFPDRRPSQHYDNPPQPTREPMRSPMISQLSCTDSELTIPEFHPAGEQYLEPGPSNLQAIPPINLTRGAPSVANGHAEGWGQMPRWMIFTRVHDICIQATKKYLEDSYNNRRVRNAAAVSAYNNFLSQQSRGVYSQFLPYAAPAGFPGGVYNNPQPQPPGGGYSQFFTYDTRRQSMPSQYATSYLADVSTGSLAGDVSRICDELWAQAQRDRHNAPETEREAVEDMAHLLDWAETIVWNVGHVTAGELEEGQALGQVIAAGKNLCAWLGDERRQALVQALWF